MAGRRVPRRFALAAVVAAFSSALVLSGCNGTSQSARGLPPGTLGPQLFARQGPSGTSVSAYQGAPACPSLHWINVVVQHGSMKQGYFTFLSGTQTSPTIEINVYATLANQPRIVIAHVDPSVSRVAWVSGSQTYDQMTPVENWVVEVGPYLPLSAWRVERPHVEGELVAYHGTREVATLAVGGPDTQPPQLPPLVGPGCSVRSVPPPVRINAS